MLLSLPLLATRRDSSNGPGGPSIGLIVGIILLLTSPLSTSILLGCTLVLALLQNALGFVCIGGSSLSGGQLPQVG